MAFIWRAVQQVNKGGVVASVLPATLFETQSGEKWREALLSCSELYLLGRFKGYTFFHGAAVEPGFLVVRRPVDKEKQDRRSVRVLLADEGAEDSAIRGLRQLDSLSTATADKSWEVFKSTAESIGTGNWLPRSAKHRRMIDLLSQMGSKRVDDLFDVRQGTKTGMDKVFVLSHTQLVLLR